MTHVKLGEKVFLCPMYDDLLELAQDMVLCSFLTDVIQVSFGDLDNVELHVELDVAFAPT